MSHEECTTCGDVAAAAVVLEVRGDTAIVQSGGERQEVATELVSPVAPGDVLLCHAGIAIRKVDR